MKKIITAIIFLACIKASSAQITVEHAFNGSTRIVNLSKSGKKIAVSDLEKVKLYNLDYSLWKTIHYPLQSGQEVLIFPSLISEELFNTDNLIEMAITISANGTFQVCIFNENSNVLFSVDSAFMISVHNTTPGVFKAIAQTGYTTYNNSSDKILSLPGTIPCDPCNSDNMGLGKPGIESYGSLSSPIPNPSTGKVTLEYQLPIGVHEGVIEIYNGNGQVVKTFRVDGQWPHLLLDNSELPSGIYFYSLKVAGIDPIARKMIIIR